MRNNGNGSSTKVFTIVFLLVCFCGCGSNFDSGDSEDPLLVEITNTLRKAEELWEAGKKQEATQLVRQFVDHKSTIGVDVLVDVHFYAGSFWYELSEHEISLSEFQKAEMGLQNQPNAHSGNTLIIWRYLAENLIILNQPEHGISYLEKIVENLSPFKDSEDLAVTLIDLASVRIAMENSNEQQLDKAHEELLYAHSIAQSISDSQVAARLLKEIDSFYDQ